MINGFEDFQKTGTENMNKAVESVSAFSKGLQALAVEAADYSKKSFEDSAAHVETLMGVQSLERVVEVQSDYVKSSYETAVAQASKMNELYVDMARDAMKPFEGLFPAVAK